MQLSLRMSVIWLLCFTGGADLFAADASSSRPAQTQSELSPQERQARMLANLAQTTALFKERKFAEAEQSVREGMKLAPQNPLYPYNLACALAQQGKKTQALVELERAIKLGYNEAAHMKADDDLASLRNDPAFEKLAKDADANRLKTLGKYEPGEDIKGIKTTEGNPEDGLRWRLRLSPDATKEKPARLIIWMHPSGASMNAPVEKLAPDLAKRGYALLVLTQKNFSGWSEDDGRRLMKATLADVAKQANALDTNKPLLLGYSAGGQMALMLYMKAPGDFGGLILDAAYPLRPLGAGRFAPMPPPKDDAAKKVPFFVIVGAMDAGAAIWQAVQKPWRDAGVPLVLHLIPQGRHEWLFGKLQLELLYRWLDEVREGKLPSTRPSTKVIL